jgi:predicted nuclease of predicted toxin-antitoxin system
MSFLLGAPPKVIWLRVGNCPTEDIERVLRENVGNISSFEQSEDATLLIIEGPTSRTAP